MPKPERARRRAVRIVIEYEDGVVTELKGEPAQEYISIVDDQAVQAWNRGARMPPLPWTRVNKNCAACGGVGELVSSTDPPTALPCACTRAPT